MVNYLNNGILNIGMVYFVLFIIPFFRIFKVKNSKLKIKQKKIDSFLRNFASSESLRLKKLYLMHIVPSGFL